MHQFTYDTLSDAQQAATLLLKGNDALKVICIIPDDDAPDEAVRKTDSAEWDRLFVRARAMSADTWQIITRDNFNG